MKFLSPGEMIQIRRKRVGKTQKEVADQAEIPLETLQKVEQERKILSRKRADKLGRVLGMPGSVITWNEAYATRLDFPELDALPREDLAYAALMQMEALNGLLEPDPHFEVGYDEEGRLVQAGGCPGKGLCQLEGCENSGPLDEEMAIEEMARQMGVDPHTIPEERKKGILALMKGDHPR